MMGTDSELGLSSKPSENDKVLSIPETPLELNDYIRALPEKDYEQFIKALAASENDGLCRMKFLHGRSIMHMIVLANKSLLIEKLLESEIRDLAFQIDRSGKTILHYAMQYDSISLDTLYAIANKAPNLKFISDKDNVLPIHYIVQSMIGKMQYSELLPQKMYTLLLEDPKLIFCKDQNGKCLNDYAKQYPSLAEHLDVLNRLDDVRSAKLQYSNHLHIALLSDTLPLDSFHAILKKYPTLVYQRDNTKALPIHYMSQIRDEAQENELLVQKSLALLQAFPSLANYSDQNGEDLYKKTREFIIKTYKENIGGIVKTLEIEYSPLASLLIKSVNSILPSSTPQECPAASNPANQPEQLEQLSKQFSKICLNDPIQDFLQYNTDTTEKSESDNSKLKPKKSSFGNIFSGATNFIPEKSSPSNIINVASRLIPSRKNSAAKIVDKTARLPEEDNDQHGDGLDLEDISPSNETDSLRKGNIPSYKLQDLDEADLDKLKQYLCLGGNPFRIILSNRSIIIQAFIKAAAVKNGDDEDVSAVDPKYIRQVVMLMTYAYIDQEHFNQTIELLHRFKKDYQAILASIHEKAHEYYKAYCLQMSKLNKQFNSSYVEVLSIDNSLSSINSKQPVQNSTTIKTEQKTISLLYQIISQHRPTTMNDISHVNQHAQAINGENITEGMLESLSAYTLGLLNDMDAHDIVRHLTAMLSKLDAKEQLIACYMVKSLLVNDIRYEFSRGENFDLAFARFCQALQQYFPSNPLVSLLFEIRQTQDQFNHAPLIKNLHCFNRVLATNEEALKSKEETIKRNDIKTLLENVHRASEKEKQEEKIKAFVREVKRCNAEMLKQLSLSEFKNKAYEKKDKEKNAPILTQFARFNSGLAYLIVETILKQKNIRVLPTIRFFQKVALELVQSDEQFGPDLNGLMSILAALNHKSIARLKGILSNITPADQAILQNINDITSVKDNYSNFRSLANIYKNYLPFMGVPQRDITIASEIEDKLSQYLTFGRVYKKILSTQLHYLYHVEEPQFTLKGMAMHYADITPDQFDDETWARAGVLHLRTSVFDLNTIVTTDLLFEKLEIVLNEKYIPEYIKSREAGKKDNFFISIVEKFLDLNKSIEDEKTRKENISLMHKFLSDCAGSFSDSSQDIKLAKLKLHQDQLKNRSSKPKLAKTGSCDPSPLEKSTELKVAKTSSCDQNSLGTSTGLNIAKTRSYDQKPVIKHPLDTSSGSESMVTFLPLHDLSCDSGDDSAGFVLSDCSSGSSRYNSSRSDSSSNSGRRHPVIQRRGSSQTDSTLSVGSPSSSSHPIVGSRSNSQTDSTLSVGSPPSSEEVFNPKSKKQQLARTPKFKRNR